MRGLQSYARTWLILLWVAIAAPCLAETSPTASVVKALWQVQKIDFSYMGFTTYYSCDGLRDRMSAIMLQLGAREDLLVTVGACDDSTGPARMPSVTIVAAFPVEATDAAIAAQQADTKRSALLARLQKASKGKRVYSDDLFNAMSKRVELSDQGGGRRALSGDCELLEQLEKRVLPQLGVKVVGSNLHCYPHAATLMTRLLVESLVATPVKS